LSTTPLPITARLSFLCAADSEGNAMLQPPARLSKDAYATIRSMRYIGIFKSKFVSPVVRDELLTLGLVEFENPYLVITELGMSVPRFVEPHANGQQSYRR
jgi:hypothetical protein